MIRPRTLRIGLAAGILMAGALSACTANDTSVDETITASPALSAASAATSVPGQCYWLSDAGEGWLAQADLSDPEFCYELDSCAGGAGLSGGGCYKWAMAADARAMPWAEFGFAVMSPPEPPTQTKASGPACYLQSGAEDPYAGAYQYWDETTCFRLGACADSAEAGDDTLACYKWAMGPDAPALAWSERLTNPVLAARIPPPKDIYEGAFEMTSDSCFEDCQPAPVRTTAETVLYERPDATSPVVGKIAAGACVRNKDYKLLSTPRRGVVLETADGFVKGDIIYDLAYDGEGNYWAWWRGDETYASYEWPKVEWDPEPEIRDPRVGYWLELLRADGTSGWARDASVDHVYGEDPECTAPK